MALMETETKIEKEPILYEIGYLLKDTLKEEQLVDFLEKLRGEISQNKEMFVSEGNAKKINLAYPIKKEVVALFNWIRIKAKPEAIEQIESFLKKEKVILRLLTIKIKKEKPLKQVLIKRPRIEKTETLVTPKTKQPKEKENKIKEEEIDKKIKELLGE